MLSGRTCQLRLYSFRTFPILLEDETDTVRTAGTVGVTVETLGTRPSFLKPARMQQHAPFTLEDETPLGVMGTFR